MSEANRSFQKGNALTDQYIYSALGIIKIFFDIEAACVPFVEPICLLLEAGHCPSLGRRQFLTNMVSLYQLCATIIINKCTS
jgi:hypothetical protein